MNESIHGSDGYILAKGRKFYHVYKQENIPSEFWYGLTPEANRECKGPQIDVRTLPKGYLSESVEIRYHDTQIRSISGKLRQQLKAHALAFALAICDGYDFIDHIRREDDRQLADAALRDREMATRKRLGLCLYCGGGGPKNEWGWCELCDETPF